jgi:ribonuclease E
MIIEENRDLVLKRLVECLSRDRTIHQVTEITSLGLVQITRKRVGRGLLEVFSEICQNCHGEGHIINTKGDSIPEPILSSSVVETSEEIKDSLKEIFLAAKVADTSDEEYENNNDDNDDDDSDDNDDIANDEIDDNLESETDDEFDEEN